MDHSKSLLLEIRKMCETSLKNAFFGLLLRLLHYYRLTTALLLPGCSSLPTIAMLSLGRHHLTEVLTIRYSPSDLNPQDARVVVVLRLQETTNSSAIRALHRCWILLLLLVSVFYVCVPILAEISSDINNNASSRTVSCVLLRLQEKVLSCEPSRDVRYESRILLQDRRPYLENLPGFEVPVRRSLC
jgi:hypothetical protein